MLLDGCFWVVLPEKISVHILKACREIGSKFRTKSLSWLRTKQCIMGPRKTTWLMDLQEQQMLTVFLFLQWLPSTWMSKIERLCGCKISKYNKGSRCSERNSGNTEWCKKVSFLLPILLQVPEVLKTTHAQFIVMMITNWGEYTNWHC